MTSNHKIFIDYIYFKIVMHVILTGNYNNSFFQIRTYWTWKNEVASLRWIDIYIEKQLRANKWEAKKWVAKLEYIFINLFSKTSFFVAVSKTTSNTVYVSRFRFCFIVMVDRW